MTALLALLIASAPVTVEPPADAPVVTHTAILETPEHTFIARGEGLWLPKSLAISRAAELAGLRARVALMTADPTYLMPTWSLVVGSVADFAVKAIVAVLTAMKAWEWWGPKR